MKHAIFPFCSKTSKIKRLPQFRWFSFWGHIKPIQQALVEKGLPPSRHLVDSSYVDADLLVLSQQKQGKQSAVWRELANSDGPYIEVRFQHKDCKVCHKRFMCTRAKRHPRNLKMKPRPQFEALKAARQYHASEEGKQLYKKRAGVEGTISQGVRGFGLRKARYRGTA